MISVNSWKLIKQSIRASINHSITPLEMNQGINSTRASIYESIINQPFITFHFAMRSARVFKDGLSSKNDIKNVANKIVVWKTMDSNALQCDAMLWGKCVRKHRVYTMLSVENIPENNIREFAFKHHALCLIYWAITIALPANRQNIYNRKQC